MLFRIENDWYRLMRQILHTEGEEKAQARQKLMDSLISLAPVFSDKEFFCSDEFTIVDCCIAVLLWRLPQLNIILPSTARPILDYAQRIFNRDSFKSSLSETEKEFEIA